MDTTALLSQAAIMLVIKDGLILAISRRHDRTKFGLPGGKMDATDQCPLDTALREITEETSVRVNKASFVYKRVELGDGANKRDFDSYTYYAEEWEGDPKNSEEGVVAWLTAEELTSTKAAFGDYNRNMLNEFRRKFPNVDLIGELCAGGCNNTGWQSGDNEGFICDLYDRACTCGKSFCYVHQGE